MTTLLTGFLHQSARSSESTNAGAQNIGVDLRLILFLVYQSESLNVASVPIIFATLMVLHITILQYTIRIVKMFLQRGDTTHTVTIAFL